MLKMLLLYKLLSSCIHVVTRDAVSRAQTELENSFWLTVLLLTGGLRSLSRGASCPPLLVFSNLNLGLYAIIIAKLY